MRRTKRREPERFFFVHIMKTGGTTFLHQLHQNFAPDEVYPNNELDIDPERFLHHLRVDYLLSLPEARREKIRAYVGHFPYVTCDLLGLDLVTLSVLRDPVDRTVSLLQQLKRNGPRHKDSTLDQIYDFAPLHGKLIANHQTKVFATKADDVPVDYRSEIVMDADRLALAKQNLARIDVLGLTEQFDDFTDELEQRFGWHFDREIRANKNETVADASPALRKRIAAENEIDIEFYEYGRELVSERSRRPRPRRRAERAG